MKAANEKLMLRIAFLASAVFLGNFPFAVNAQQWPAPTVALLPLNSKAIKATGYDENKKLLFIEFVRGKHPYTYCAVPAKLESRLRASDSPGHFYNTEIKGKFSCTPPN